METILYKKSGLLGTSGISSDTRDLLGRAEPRPVSRWTTSVPRCQGSRGSLAAGPGCIDGPVFTAGILVGENSPGDPQAKDARPANGWGWNLTGKLTPIGVHESPYEERGFNLGDPTNEELMIVQHTGRLLGFYLSRTSAFEGRCLFEFPPVAGYNDAKASTSRKSVRKCFIEIAFGNHSKEVQFSRLCSACVGSGLFADPATNWGQISSHPLAAAHKSPSPRILGLNPSRARSCNPSTRTGCTASPGRRTRKRHKVVLKGAEVERITNGYRFLA